MNEKNVVIPKRVRALFALDKLSKKLQSDVLTDPATVKLWNIPTQRTMPLPTGLIVQGDSLFSIFRAAADGNQTPPLLDEKKREHEVAASIDPDGTGLLEVAKDRIRFPRVLLMSGSPETRLRELERILRSVTIHAGLQDELRHRVGRSEFGVDEFMAVAKILSSSPEEFQACLSEKASMRRLALSDVLPDDHRHWDNLTAPIADSGTLVDFIANELASERTGRLATNPVLGFCSIALTFSAPALVPVDLFGPLDKEAKKRILEQALHLEDHFSLIGAFELCADWIVENPTFAEAGERLLDRLFGDLNALRQPAECSEQH